MIVLRLFDPNRHPSNWTEIIRVGQYAAFSKRADMGAPCDAGGRVFATTADATCLLFDSLDDAQRFCEEQVLRAPDVRFEIFDWTGRAEGPLVVIVHPSRRAALDGNPRGMRVRAWSATSLLAASVALFWYDYQHDQGKLIFPTALGVNLVVVAARLFQLNASYAHSARVRERRVLEHMRADSGHLPRR